MSRLLMSWIFVGATTLTGRVRKMPSTNSKYVAVSIVVSHAGSQLLSVDTGKVSIFV
jgi:hypothetical protein